MLGDNKKCYHGYHHDYFTIITIIIGVEQKIDVPIHHTYSKIPYAQHCSMTLYSGIFACFSTNHSLHFAGEQDTSDGTTL